MKKLFAGMMCTAMLASLPAFAEEPTMPLAPNPTDSAPVAPAPVSYTVESDGALLDLAGLAPYVKDGHVMVPVRAVAESLGFTVTWIGENQSVKLDNGTVYTVVALGVDSYSRTSSTAIGMGRPEQFGVAPELSGGSTFVPAEMFTVLDYEVTAADGVVAINTRGEGAVERPNPIQEFVSVSAARSALSFPAQAPSTPDGYELTGINTIGGTALQLVYTKGEHSITYRTAQGSEDISGDFNQYASAGTHTVGDLTINTKGEGEAISLATWTQDGMAFSLRFSTPVDAGVLDAIVSSLA